MNLEQLARALQSLDSQAAETVQAAVKEIAALEKDNDDIHELAEHYRVENKRLREALREIAEIEMYVDADGLWEESPALDSGQMWDIARAALEPKPMSEEDVIAGRHAYLMDEKQ